MALHRHEFTMAGEHGLGGMQPTVTRCNRCGIVIGYGDRCEYCQGRLSGHVDEPGDYAGRHHTEWVTTVDELLIQGDEDEAEFLLWKLVDASEAESLLAGVPPFERHFRRLGQLAKRRNDPRLAAEVNSRYEQCAAKVSKDGRAAI